MPASSTNSGNGPQTEASSNGPLMIVNHQPSTRYREDFMAWKVLVTARAFWVSGQAAEAALRDAGCEVVRSFRAGPLTEDELIAALDGCQAVIASSDPYN